MRFDNLAGGTPFRPAEDFLVASRVHRWDRAAFASMALDATDEQAIARAYADCEPDGEVALTALPDSPPLRLGLGEAIAARRSVRRFSGAPVGLAGVAALVRHAGAVTAEVDMDLQAGGAVQGAFRAVPSGGALYPVELWVAALRVDGLTRGVHRYLPRRDALALWADGGAVDGLLASYFDVEQTGVDLGHAALLVLLVGRPWRSMRRYGTRGLRFLLHECGGIAQCVHLAAVALALGSVDSSGFCDDDASAALGIDGLYRAPLHTIVIGALR